MGLFKNRFGIVAGTVLAMALPLTACQSTPQASPVTTTVTVSAAPVTVVRTVTETPDAEQGVYKRELAFFGALVSQDIPLPPVEYGPMGEQTTSDQRALQLGYLVCAAYPGLSQDRLLRLVQDVDWPLWQRAEFVKVATMTLCP